MSFRACLGVILQQCSSYLANSRPTVSPDMKGLRGNSEGRSSYECCMDNEFLHVRSSRGLEGQTPTPEMGAPVNGNWQNLLSPKCMISDLGLVVEGVGTLFLLAKCMIKEARTRSG